MKNKALLIMAAGLGSRFGAEKQFIPFGPNGECILDYSIYDALECGFDRIIIVIRQSMRPSLEMRYSKLLEKHEIIFCDQEADTLPRFFTPPSDRVKPYGTSHALMCAAQFLDYPTLIINADDFYGKETFVLMSQFMNTLDDSKIGLACFPLSKTLSSFGAVTRGLCCINENDDLISVTETYSVRKNENGDIICSSGQVLHPDTPASMNVLAVTPSFPYKAQPYFEEFFNTLSDNDMNSELPLPVLIDRMVKDGQISAKAIRVNSDWLGVTFFEDMPFVKETLNMLIENGIYPSPIFD